MVVEGKDGPTIEDVDWGFQTRDQLKEERGKEEKADKDITITDYK
jgi:hypothetical protein